jgi:hypothetical protein
MERGLEIANPLAAKTPRNSFGSLEIHKDAILNLASAFREKLGRRSLSMRAQLVKFTILAENSAGSGARNHLSPTHHHAAFSNMLPLQSFANFSQS